jgi:hypothetical protein
MYRYIQRERGRERNRKRKMRSFLIKGEPRSCNLIDRLIVLIIWFPSPSYFYNWIRFVAKFWRMGKSQGVLEKVQANVKRLERKVLLDIGRRWSLFLLCSARKKWDLGNSFSQSKWRPRAFLFGAINRTVMLSCQQQSNIACRRLPCNV